MIISENMLNIRLKVANLSRNAKMVWEKPNFGFLGPILILVNC